MAGTAQLTKTWWEKNRPDGVSKTGIGDALRKFEIAVAKDDDTQVLKSISELRDKVAATLKSTDKGKHPKTVTTLKEYDTLLDKQEELAKGRIARAKAAPTGAPAQQVGKDVTVWGIDLGVEATKVVDPAWLGDFKGFTMSLTLNDDILTVLEKAKDVVTPAFMVEDAQKVGAEAVAQVVTKIKQLDSKASQLSAADLAKARDILRNQVVDVLKFAEPQLKAIPKARWERFVARNQQYKDYKIKSGVKVTVGVLTVAGSAAAIAGSQGAALPLAIVSMVRGCTAIVKTCYDLALDADKVGKDLKADIETLQKRYQDASRTQQGAIEAGASVLKGILGTDAPFVATLPKARANYELWDNKVAGVTVNGRKAGKAIKMTLAKCDELEAKLKTVPDKKAKDVYKQLVAARAKVNDALDGVADLMGKVRRFEEAGPQLEQALAELESDNPKWAVVFDKLFPTAVSLALAAASAGEGFKAAQSLLETVNAAVGLTQEFASSGKDQWEQWV
ncbi:hypothetical protein [Jatrophihabitans fulvus]